MEKKNEYEVACDYYKNDDDPSFSLDEAIEKFKIAGENGCHEAYLDLANLYLDNFPNDDDHANNEIFKNMRSAAEKGCKGAYASLADIFLSKRYKCLEKEYTNLDRRYNAIKWYLKAPIDDRIEDRVIKCLDVLNDYYEKRTNDEKIIFIEKISDIVDNIKINNKKINNKIKSCCYKTLERIYYFDIARASTDDDYNNIRDFLKTYNKLSKKLGLYDDFYLRYGDFLYESIENIEQAKLVLETYNKSKNNTNKKIKCINKIYHRIGMLILYNSDDIYSMAEAYEYFKDLDASYFLEDDKKLIDKKIDFARKSNEVDLAFKYADKFHSLFYYDVRFDSRYKKLKAIIDFNDALKKTETGDYEATLYVANAYFNGIGTRKNIKEASKLYLDIFIKYKNLDALEKLFAIEGDLKKVLSKIDRKSNEKGTAIQYAIEATSKYFSSENGFVTLDNSSLENDFAHLIPKQSGIMDYGCLKNGFCDKWFEYRCKFSNEYYYRKYHDDYCKVNQLIFEQLFLDCQKLLKKEITIILVGCGNLYELESLNIIAKNNPSKKINVIMLDNHVWANNTFYKIKNDIYLNSLKIKNCDFYDELQKFYYKFADIVYFSRCLDHYNYFAKEITDKLDKIIDSNQITVFSQAVNASSEHAGTNEKKDSIKFENEIREYFDNNYNILHAFKIDKDRNNIDDDNLNYNSIGINYFAYFISGRRK